MTTDPFTGRQGERNQYVRAELAAKKDAQAAPKWRVRKDVDMGADKTCTHREP